MHLLVQDIRHALRALLKQPAWLLTAVLTLALGIGFTTGTFSVIHAVLLKPLPYEAPERLVQLRERHLPQFPQSWVSPPHFLFWREQNSSFSSISGLIVQSVNLDRGSDDPQRVQADRVSTDIFTTLGVAPLLGRTFQPDDERGPRGEVAVLSYDAWRQLFAGSPAVIGQTIRLDRAPFTIVGVMPAGFLLPGSDAELWVPIVFTDDERRAFSSHFMTAIGRLQPGVTLEAAETDMQAVAARLAEASPGSDGWEVLLFDLQDYAVRDTRTSLLVLFGAVSLVLLIACANVANLVLARGAVRQKELAIRSSIGATRARLVRQLLIEQLALASVSAAAGILIAAWLLRVLLAIVPDALPPHADVGLDRNVLAFAVGLAIATPLLFGLLPALQASRPDLRRLMSSGQRAGGGIGAAGTRTALVVAEIALAMTLLVGAGLLIRSFTRLANEAPGFEPAGALLAAVSLPDDGYASDDARARFAGAFLDRVRSLPQVEAAGLSVPMTMVDDYNTGYEIEGEPAPSDGSPVTRFYAVTSGYFDAMRIPLLRGRSITDEDRREGRRVIVINQAIAERHFAGRDPVGHRMRVGQGTAAWREIIGVVGNTKHSGLDEQASAQVYEPYLQHAYLSTLSVIVRSQGAATTALVPQLRAALRGQDPDLALARVRTLEQVVDTTVRPQRFLTALITAFSGAALLLAAVGLYGVIAYTVGLRRQEFAIRVAHGAGPGDILGLVLKGAAGMAVAGIAIGLVAAWLLKSVIQSLLFNVSSADPLTYGVVAAVLILTALSASAVPALRAARIDPVQALRD